MLEQIKKLQQPLWAVLLDKPREVRSLLPDGDEWTVIKELLDVLKPFHQATKTMSASSYPTLSMLSPLLYQLKVLVLTVPEKDSQTTKQLTQAILLDLQYRYPKDVQAVLDMSAFLDLRFKDLDPFVDVADRADVEEAVKCEALELAEGNKDDTLEAVTLDNVDNIDLPLNEINNDHPQDQQQSSSSELAPSKKKEKRCSV